jgi:hypothetical protein
MSIAALCVSNPSWHHAATKCSKSCRPLLVHQCRSKVGVLKVSVRSVVKKELLVGQLP